MTPTLESMEATTATDGAAHGLRRRPAATAACVLAALATLAVFLLAATPAFAGFELVQEFAKSGEGQLVAPFEVAVNDTSGEVYVADTSRASILRYAADGEFLGAFGYDVVARGPDDSSNNAKYQFTVKATGGTFELYAYGFEVATNTTGPIPFNASAATVEAALNGPTSIGGLGGSVTVTGGPGDEGGSSPYVVTFGGGLGGDAVGFEANGNGLTGPGKGAAATRLNLGGAYEHCELAAGDTCQKGQRGLPGNPFGELRQPYGVAIDQATGNVYFESGNEAGYIYETTASGQLITSFGEAGSESPEQIKNTSTQPIAVDSANGDVLVLDSVASPNSGRVMTFKPKTPGDFSEYEYAGQSHDLQLPGWAEHLALDAQGDIFTSYENRIYEFDGPKPASPPSHEFNADLARVDVESMTVEPKTGTVIYYSSKARKFFELSKSLEPIPGGEFSAPNLIDIRGLAFNPNLVWSTGRPPGVLYASSPQSGPGTEARALVLAEADTFPPVVDGEAVQSVGPTFATLTAHVDPRGFATHYRFEYGNEGPCSKAHCIEAPTGGGEAGAGTTAEAVSATVQDLVAGTEYCFRAVAENESGATDGPDICFRTYPALEAGLPDGRAYELVSPVEKHGGEVFPADPEVGSCSACEPGIGAVRMPEQSSPDGEAIVYEASPFSEASEGEGSGPAENEYLAARTASGWQTSDLSVEGETEEGGYRAFTTDLARGVLREKEVPLTDGGLPAGYENLYLREADGTLSPFIRELPELLPQFTFRLEYAGGDAALDHIAFEANEPLTPQTPLAPAAPLVTGGERDLYERTADTIRLVNVLPGNASSAPGSVFGAGQMLSPSEQAAPDTSTAVSSDGSRIFWTNLLDGRLYVRERGETTREVVHRGRCLGKRAVNERSCFLVAGADGAKVLLSDGRLYDVDAQPTVKLFDLTKGHGGFMGIAGASADLSRVYFVDTEVVTEEEGPTHAVADAGLPNLYVYEARAGAVHFIATLQQSDNERGVDGVVGAWAPAAADRLAQATSDGRFLVFDSSASLTGYDNTIAGEHCGAGSEPRACGEIYEYDAQARSLTCVSCNPTGARPAGPSMLSPPAPSASRFPQPRNLTPDGRVFFDSLDALTAADLPGVESVYEYERHGQGTCEATDGCVSSISPGDSKLDASFLSADESGKNVFFTTRAQVLPDEDQDELVDLYDAREGGGFATPTPPVPVPESCSGEACPPQPSPSSSSQEEGSTSQIQQPAGAAPNGAVESSTVRHAPMTKCPKGKSRDSRHRCATRAQLLAQALRRCRRRHAGGAKRTERGTCERQARKRYGPTSKQTTKSRPRRLK